MKGPRKTSMAVRLPDGTIDLSELSANSLRDKYKFWQIPFLRGIATFIDSMRIGFSALGASAEKSGLEEDEEPSKFDRWVQEKFGDKMMSVIMAAGTVLGVLLAVVLFFFLLFHCCFRFTVQSFFLCFRCLLRICIYRSAV